MSAASGSRELNVDDLATLRTRRSAKWRTYPPDVLPLFVAEMDYPLAPAVRAALRDAIDRDDVGYCFAGQPFSPSPFTAAVGGFAARRWGWRIDEASMFAVPDVTTGAIELLRALRRVPRDNTASAGRQRVVICPPVYPPFYDWVVQSDSELIEVALAGDPATGYRLDLDGLQQAFAGGAEVFALCNPHNPVGRVHTPQELAAVADLAARYGVRVISDEIHAPLVLDGATFTPFLTVPGAAQVGVSLVSASKAWNLAGLKAGVAVAGSPRGGQWLQALPPDLAWHPGHLGILATEVAFAEGEPWLDDLLFTLDQRRRQLADLLAEHLPQVVWTPPQATYLAWLDCRAYADNPQERILEQGRVALEPGERFGPSGRGFVRLNFATSAEILAQAVAAMAGALT